MRIRPMFVIRVLGDFSRYDNRRLLRANRNERLNRPGFTETVPVV
jgi:hypothetical protein